MGDPCFWRAPHLSRAHHSCYMLEAVGRTFSAHPKDAITSLFCWLKLTPNFRHFIFSIPIFQEAMGLQVALVGCLSQLLLHNKYKYHSGIQQEVFLTLCLRVSGGGFASDCRSPWSPGAALHNPDLLGPMSCFPHGHSRSRTANSAAQLHSSLCSCHIQ